MINAIILVHLWSLVVAGGAWGLQRDGNGRVGAHFPSSTIWFALIMLCLLPGALCFIPFGAAVNLPKLEGFEILPIQISDSTEGGAWLSNFLLIYMGLCVLLMSRTLWRWSSLQGVPLTQTAEPDIFTTTAELPPLTLSWPRRAVVVPQGLENRPALIGHERAHLRHYDAELTLFLLLLQDMMLRNPGVSYLVRQWRLAIELRADHLATKTLTLPERKDYAALLLNIQRPATPRSEMLPCPTARLYSTSHRNAKMRLVAIMEDAIGAKQHRWPVAVSSMFFAAGGVGLVSAGAAANGADANAGSEPVDYVQVNYVRQTPLHLPASCPGLIDDIKRRNVEVEEKVVTVNGQPVSQKTMKLGTVVLSHDVRRDGRIFNPVVINSTHPCFDVNAKTGIAQWTAEPQGSHVKNAAVKLHFVISGATNEELNQQLKIYLQ